MVDFGRDTAILASFAKPLLLELLSQSGALIDDFETWQVGAKGKQVSFEGKLSNDGLRRLLSVVEPPAHARDFAVIFDYRIVQRGGAAFRMTGVHAGAVFEQPGYGNTVKSGEVQKYPRVAGLRVLRPA